MYIVVDFAVCGEINNDVHKIDQYLAAAG